VSIVAKSKVRLTAAEFREKHARRTKAATADMAEGVKRVTVAPGKLAAAKEDKMKQNLVASIDSGKWRERVAAVDLGEWQDKMLTKGVGRVAAGIDGAGDRVENFAGQLISHQNSLLGKIGSMPDMTLEDSVNRASEWIRGMGKFTYKR
jgi:hypothetical protein